MDCSLPRCSIHGISQARKLEWVVILHLYNIEKNYTSIKKYIKYKLKIFLWMQFLMSQRKVFLSHSVVVVHSLSHVQPFTTQWTAACQASLSSTICQSLLKLMSTESVMPSNHLILWHPIFLPLFPLLSIFSQHQSFTNELAISIIWPKYGIEGCYSTWGKQNLSSAVIPAL